MDLDRKLLANGLLVKKLFRVSCTFSFTFPPRGWTTFHHFYADTTPRLVRQVSPPQASCTNLQPRGSGLSTCTGTSRVACASTWCSRTRVVTRCRHPSTGTPWCTALCRVRTASTTPSSRVSTHHHLDHPAKSALTPYWSAKSFVMVVHEQFFSPALDKKFWLKIAH